MLIVRSKQRAGVIYAAICKRGVFCRADRLFPYRDDAPGLICKLAYILIVQRYRHVKGASLTEADRQPGLADEIISADV